MGNEILIALIGFASAIGGGLIVYYQNKRLNSSNADSVNADTIKKLSEQVNELILDKNNMQEQIDWLKEQLSLYVNGYAKALKFINKHTRKDVEIPDFLITDPKIKTPPKEVAKK